MFKIEIALDTRYPIHEGEIFPSARIQRNACMTFLAQRGFCLGTMPASCLSFTQIRLLCFLCHG